MPGVVGRWLVYSCLQSVQFAGSGPGALALGHACFQYAMRSIWAVVLSNMAVLQASFMGLQVAKTVPRKSKCHSLLVFKVTSSKLADLHACAPCARRYPSLSYKSTYRYITANALLCAILSVVC